MSESSNLLRLQQLDLELSRIRKTAEELPQRAKINAARAAQKKLNSELNKIVGERKDLETEINDLEVHKKFLTDKVTEVQGLAPTDFRSTKDIEYSLSSLAKKLEKVDFDNEKIVARLEVVEKAEANARKLADQLKNEEAQLTEAFKLATAELQQQVRSIGAEREQLVSALGEETYNTYMSASKRFGGLAVEQLEGNRPSVCRVNLQPSSFADIRRSKAEITTCPYCKRMLIVSNNEEA